MGKHAGLLRLSPDDSATICWGQSTLLRKRSRPLPTPHISTTYITATEICDMLAKVAKEYAGKTIHIALDNAKYQKCDAVKNLAAALGIEFRLTVPI